MNCIKLITLVCLLACVQATAQKNGDYFFLKVYHYKNAAQENKLNDFLKNDYVPALRKNGFKTIGVFQTLESDTVDNRFYVLVSSKKIAALKQLEMQKTSNAYFDAPYNEPAFGRIEVIVLSAFPMATQLMHPNLTAPKNERVYELRSYESPSENYFANKVHMFNEGGETSLFKRLNFNAVFYASVLAGSKMPNLMYMTSFNSKQDRDEHWKKFGIDDQWKKLSSDPFYKNNVSHIDITFLRGVSYSDL